MHIDQYELYMVPDSLGQDLCGVITGNSFKFQVVSATCSNSDTSSSLKVWGFVSLDQRFSIDCWHSGPENSFLVHCRIFSSMHPWPLNTRRWYLATAHCNNHVSRHCSLKMDKRQTIPQWRSRSCCIRWYCGHFGINPCGQFVFDHRSLPLFLKQERAAQCIGVCTWVCEGRQAKQVFAKPVKWKAERKEITGSIRGLARKTETTGE